ncbi:MAG TPA: GspH/FimT family pseudopilin [Thermoanaerobaculia bacterium]|nr:GspH/FimT family pseudopilin [Thermoanaerobaculia bacterium]
MSKQSGHSLIELLIVLAIIGLCLGIGLPSFGTMQRRAALRVAAGELRAIFHLTRKRAILRGEKSGVKFFLDDGEWKYAVYDDGDGDGVRSDDINRGTDPRVTEPRRALRETDAAVIGLLPRRVNAPDGTWLTLQRSPVQFGRSTICSFSPVGESSPGTIYLTSGQELFAVRVYGRSAKIRTLRYEEAERKWVSQ